MSLFIIENCVLNIESSRSSQSVSNLILLLFEALYFKEISFVIIVLILIIFHYKSLDPSSMRIAAIALSGFNQDKNGIWRSQCIVALNQITDSHLRAIFAFLTSDTEGYESVLVKFYCFQAK